MMCREVNVKRCVAGFLANQKFEFLDCKMSYEDKKTRKRNRSRSRSKSPLKEEKRRYKVRKFSFNSFLVLF